MDGLKLCLEQSGSHAIQNAFYNGWKHDHYVSNIFLFALDGMVQAMVINVPGSIHDSTTAEFGFIYDKLQSLHDKCENNVKSKNGRELLLNIQATSVRQLSEWGMHGFQGLFPH
eukprot:11605089-Ditylum_brightwellii.AAC.1